MSDSDRDARLRVALETPIVYARSKEHDQFLRSFVGDLKGRYLLAYAVGIEVVSGRELRLQVERELGDPRFEPETLYDIRYLVVMLDRAMRQGLSSERLGELIVPTRKRTNPQAFAGKTVGEAFQSMIDGYRADSSVGDFQLELAPGHARVLRGDFPGPCEMFVGVIRGLLRVMGTTGTAEETVCRWRGGVKRCIYDAHWQEPKQGA
jgi:hypothetical protein